MSVSPNEFLNFSLPLVISLIHSMYFPTNTIRIIQSEHAIRVEKSTNLTITPPFNLLVTELHTSYLYGIQRDINSNMYIIANIQIIPKSDYGVASKVLRRTLLCLFDISYQALHILLVAHISNALSSGTISVLEV